MPSLPEQEDAAPRLYYQRRSEPLTRDGRPDAAPSAAAEGSEALRALPRDKVSVRPRDNPNPPGAERKEVPVSFMC